MRELRFRAEALRIPLPSKPRAIIRENTITAKTRVGATDRPGRGVISSTIVIHLFADDFLGFQPIFHMSLRLSPPLLIEFVRFLRDPFSQLVRILLHGLRLR